LVARFVNNRVGSRQDLRN
jgi:hypothetical protein